MLVITPDEPIQLNRKKMYAWLAFIVISNVVLLSNGYYLSNNTFVRVKRQSCSIDQFKCSSGECVSEDVMCDGVEDCTDGSDENNCSKFPCPREFFRCTYGACINPDHACDGIKHCKDNSDETHSKCKKTDERPNIVSKCSQQEFQCANEQCIDDIDLCDGKANCLDGSDETSAACGSQKCAKFAFKCAYGACINLDLKCNDISDCYDSSDEIGCPNSRLTTTSTTTTTTTPTTTKPTTSTTTVAPIEITTNDYISPVTTREGSTYGCTLPPYPTNGKWQVFGPSDLPPGQSVDNGTVLKYECSPQFALHPSNPFVYCAGKWSDTPQCLRTCSAIMSTKKMTVKCSLDGSNVDCNTPYHGTQAMLECNTFYEDPTLETRPNRFCEDGSWDYSLPQCEPICGLKSTEAQPLVIGGQAAKKGDYPWMIGLYRVEDQTNICGGSMITPSITLTAAHCFEGNYDPKSYLLAAGKYHREYTDPRDVDTQYSGIKEIKIPTDYNNGVPYFAFDIAILVLDNPFKISRSVLPVCIDFNPKFDETNLVDINGVVTGWGFTTGVGTPSDVLKVLQVNYKTQQTCTLADDFKQYYNFAKDKMCAGPVNQGESSCQGDSGGGLMFKKSGRYYIRGIVSVGARDRSTFGCDVNQLTLFTAVHYHAALIQSYVNKNKT